MNLENVEEFLHFLIERPAKTQRRRVSLCKPFATSRYKKQNNKSSRYNHTNSHYVKKNFAQQPSSKIEIRSTPTPPKATQNSAFQEEMTPSNFPTLPSQKTASEHQEESRQPEDPFETTQRMIRELFNQLNH